MAVNEAMGCVAGFHSTWGSDMKIGKNNIQVRFNHFKHDFNNILISKKVEILLSLRSALAGWLYYRRFSFIFSSQFFGTIRCGNTEVN